MDSKCTYVVVHEHLHNVCSCMYMVYACTWCMYIHITCTHMVHRHTLCIHIYGACANMVHALIQCMHMYDVHTHILVVLAHSCPTYNSFSLLQFINKSMAITNSWIVYIMFTFVKLFTLFIHFYKKTKF